MKTAITTIDPYTVEATISLDQSDLATYRAAAQEHLAASVKIEGFRAGKAPKHLVDRAIDPKVAHDEALTVALEDSFTKAAEEQKWDIAKTTDLKVGKHDADEMEYTIRVHLWPQVTLPDLAAIKVSRNEPEVTDADIDEALDTVRNMRATFLDKTGSAADGDRVEIDFDSTVAGTPVEGGTSRNHPLVIGGKSFMPGFEDQLVGMAAGDKRQFTVTAPADYYEQKVAGKAIDFAVTMNRVQAVLKPAADDAFAQSVGKFESMDALRAALRGGIAADKKEKEGQRVRIAILNGVIGATDVPAPEVMVKEELDSMIARFSRDLAGRGMDLSLYLARIGKPEEALRADWMSEAQRQVKIMLVMRTIARKEGIATSNEEVEAALADAMSALVRQGGTVGNTIDPERARSTIAERLLTEKILAFLERTCTA